MMSSYPRQNRSSWHVGYSPSVDVNSNTTSSYGRYSSSDYVSKLSTGGYRRHSASDHNRYGSSGSTGGDCRFGSGTTSDSRRYSSTTGYSKRYSASTTFDKYGSSGVSGDRRKKPWDFPMDSRRNSTSECNKSVDEIREVERRGVTRENDGGDKLESVRMRTSSSKCDRTDAKMNDSERTVSLENDDESDRSFVFRRKCSIDSRRTHLGLDYNKVVQEGDGKC